MALSKIGTDGISADTAINGFTPTVSNMAGRNLLINGGFNVWQLGTGDRPDMWRQEPRSGTTVSMERSTDVPAGTNLSYSFRSHALTGTINGYHFRTAIELPSTGNYGMVSAGTKLTLSFWAKKTASAAQTYLNPVIFLASGMFGGTTSQSASPAEGAQTLTNSWQRYVLHYTCPTWTADTGSLTDVNSLVIRLLMGSDNTTQELYLAGVQLEYGESDSEFEYRGYADELRNCLRYFWMVYNSATYSNRPLNIPVIMQANASSGVGAVLLQHPVPMRSAPSVTFLNATDSYMNWPASGSVPVTSGSSIWGQNNNQYTAYLVNYGSGSAAYVAGSCMVFDLQGNSVFYLSAEL